MSNIATQVIDIRTSRSRYQFVDGAAEQAHQQRMQAFRDAIPATVKYVVGPDDRVQGRDGQWFEAGAPITPEDVAADPGWPAQGRPHWRVFEGLVRSEVVLENYAHDPRAATTA